MRAQIVLQGDLNEDDYQRARQRLNEFGDDLRQFLARECGVEAEVVGATGKTDEYKTPSLEIVSAEIICSVGL